MTTSLSFSDRKGIVAQFVGRAGTAPRARFHPNGDVVWEFVVRVTDTWAAGAGSIETVSVRVPDQHYAQLQKWVTPGANMFLRGWLWLARWKSDKTGKELIRLIMDAEELMPVDKNGYATAQGSEPAAMDYRGRVTSPSLAPEVQAMPEPATRLTKAQAAAKFRAQRDAEEADGID